MDSRIRLPINLGFWLKPPGCRVADVTYEKHAELHNLIARP